MNPRDCGLTCNILLDHNIIPEVVTCDSEHSVLQSGGKTPERNSANLK
jgi:hypothetical protein